MHRSFKLVVALALAFGVASIASAADTTYVAKARHHKRHRRNHRRATELVIPSAPTTFATA
jgi:hypothetical protein